MDGTGAVQRAHRVHAVKSGYDVVTTLVELVIAGDRIDFIEAQDAHVQINAGGKGYRAKQSLTDLEKQLDQSRFVRVGSAYILNIASVAHLEHGAQGYRALLLDGSCIPMSGRSYQKLKLVLSRHAPHDSVPIELKQTGNIIAFSYSTCRAGDEIEVRTYSACSLTRRLAAHGRR